MTQEAMKLALEALSAYMSATDSEEDEKAHSLMASAFFKLKEVLEEEPKQEQGEPVAWMYEYWDDHHDSATGGQWRKNMTRLPLDLSNCRNVEPLYTTPQPKQEQDIKE